MNSKKMPREAFREALAEGALFELAGLRQDRRATWFRVEANGRRHLQTASGDLPRLV